MGQQPLRQRESWQNRDREPDNRSGFGIAEYEVTSPPAPRQPSAPILSATDLLLQRLGRMVDSLDAILAEMRAEDAAGKVYGTAVVVNSTSWAQTTFAQPLFSITLTNDGIVAVQYKIPTGNALFNTLNPSEVQSFSATKAVFKDISFRLPTNIVGTPSVRLSGLW